MKICWVSLRYCQTSLPVQMIGSYGVVIRLVLVLGIRDRILLLGFGRCLIFLKSMKARFGLLKSGPALIVILLVPGRGVVDPVDLDVQRLQLGALAFPLLEQPLHPGRIGAGLAGRGLRGRARPRGRRGSVVAPILRRAPWRNLLANRAISEDNRIDLASSHRPSSSRAACPSPAGSRDCRTRGRSRSPIGTRRHSAASHLTGCP